MAGIRKRGPRAKGKGPKRKRPKTRWDRLKEEVARELGLGEKLRQLGWGGLTAADSGRVGGIMGRRKKKRT